MKDNICVGDKVKTKKVTEKWINNGEMIEGRIGYVTAITNGKVSVEMNDEGNTEIYDTKELIVIEKTDGSIYQLVYDNNTSSSLTGYNKDKLIKHAKEHISNFASKATIKKCTPILTLEKTVKIKRYKILEEKQNV